jgi:twinkle protein
MKYKHSENGLVYELDFPQPGRYECPVCSVKSKRKNPKDLEFYKDSEIAYCFKCNASYFPYKPFTKDKEYILPKRVNETKLSDTHLKYWEGRMISQKTLNKLGVFSHGDWMCFPYFRGEDWVNVKSRTIDKRFQLVKGAELTWYNFNELTDADKIIICEGEGEVLTWVENGFDWVISVPNGANKNTEYLDLTIRLFDQIQRVYIANDNDEKGVELRDELARRIGPEKCVTINYRECKDGNEYFCKYGGIEFKKLIEDAKPIPLKGIVRVDSIQQDIIDLYENGIQPGKTIGFEEIDKYCTWELGRLAVVTGVPGSGKSEFVDFITTRLNLLHGWKSAYFTPENYPLKFHYAKLHEKFSGKKFTKNFDDGKFWGVYEHISENFYYILNEEDMTVDSVMDGAKMLVKQYGVKILVVDPYNKLEHQYNSSQTETQYVSKFLDRLTLFSKMNNVLVILVAHPRKLQKGEIPTLYDISGSANFYNKTDYGLTVHRDRDDNNMMVNSVQVHWQKIKFKHLGEQGVSQLKYNYKNGRFETGSVDQWDDSNWLYKNAEEHDDITTVLTDTAF